MRYSGRGRAFKAFTVTARAMLGATVIFVAACVLIIAVYTSVSCWKGKLEAVGDDVAARLAIENIIPSLGMGKSAELAKSAINFLLGFDITRPDTIIESHISALGKRKSTESVPETEIIEEAKPEEAEGEHYPIVEVSSVVGGISGNGDGEKVYINNATSFDISVDELLAEPLSIEKGDGPLVLIVHTHTTESYTPSGRNDYTPEESTRTQDKSFNVVRVGNAIAEELTAAGIETLHDESINDYPSYNGSYKKTLGVIEEYLAKYPSIRVVLDVHRDGMMRKDGTKLKLCADIDGHKAAQVMLVCGSNEGGLTHPNWRENLKLGLRFQEAMVKNCNGLARPLHFVKERYNQHATKGSLILEVGTDGNTLEEAVLGARYAARSIAQVLEKI